MTMPLKHLHSYTVEFKVLVKWLRENNRNVSKTAREFSVDRKRVQEWDKYYDKLLEDEVGRNAKKSGCDCKIFMRNCLNT